MQIFGSSDLISIVLNNLSMEISVKDVFGMTLLLTSIALAHRTFNIFTADDWINN